MSALTDGRTGKRPPSNGGRGGCGSMILMAGALAGALWAALVAVAVLVVR